MPSDRFDVGLISDAYTLLAYTVLLIASGNAIHVEDHDVEPLGARKRETGATIAGFLDGEPGKTEVQAQEIPDGWLVLDDQDPSRSGLMSSSRHVPSSVASRHSVAGRHHSVTLPPHLSRQLFLT